MLKKMYSIDNLRNDLSRLVPRDYRKWMSKRFLYTLNQVKFKNHDSLINKFLKVASEIVIKSIKIDQIVRITAQKILEHDHIKNNKQTERNDREEIISILRWVKANIRYTKDPFGIETFYFPQAMLLFNATGDCDDFSILLSALYRSIGYSTRFRAMAGKNKKLIHHVYIEVFLPQEKKWVGVDAIHKKKPHFYIPEESRSIKYPI
jgi:hypothetical protein